ncbi:MAG: UDP-N-acetylmuramoyl-L-alanyl-D-glutamate--2,6-diaminopimelate ligase [Candidatus Caccovivens sp.]
MLLKELLQQNDLKTRQQENIEIKNICRDSRNIQNGDLYFCLTNDFELVKQRCEQALEAGASAVVSNFDLPFEKTLKVQDARESFAVACANFYERACDDLKIIGVTGTNGKTSTCHITSEILKRNGHNVGVIGTSGVFYSGKVFDCPLTTPDADFLHKTFLDMKNAGVEYVVMEVSAHAIDQKRVYGIKFEIGVLTNITQDHLDYFGTFENYEKCKLSFFTKQNMKLGIICSDDASAQKLIGNSDIPLITYGLNNPADVFAIDVCCSLNGTHFVGNICDKVVDIKTNLIGEYNVYNSLASLSICQSLGLSQEELVRGLNFINPVEGRFNVINLSGRYVVIDYAHSPDGIVNILKTARDLCDKKVFLIFGCGGNRDKLKRPLMGKIACEYADMVCLTDDNPRYEKSMDIIKDIEAGMNKPHMVETDRATAIKKVLDIAREGDIVLIAGKGAEKYQEINGKKRKYNDFDAVYEYYKSSKLKVGDEEAL